MIKKPGTSSGQPGTSATKPRPREPVGTGVRKSTPLGAKGAPLIEPSKTLEEKDVEISRTIEAMRIKNEQLKQEIEGLEHEDQNRAAKPERKSLNEAKYISKMQKLADEKKVLEREMKLIENRIKHILAQNETMESEIQGYDSKARKVLQTKQKKIEWEKQLEKGKEDQQKQLIERRKDLITKEKLRKEDIGQRASQKSTIENARAKALAKEREMQESIRNKIAQLDQVLFEQKQLQIAKMSKTHQTDQSHIEYLKRKERCDVLEEKTNDEDDRVAEMKAKLEQMKQIEQQMMESKKNTMTMKNNLKSRFQDILNGKMKEEEVTRLLEEQQYRKSDVQRNSSYQKMMEKLAETQKKTPKKPSRAASKSGLSPQDSKASPSARKSISNLPSKSGKETSESKATPETQKVAKRTTSVTGSGADKQSKQDLGKQPKSATREEARRPQTPVKEFDASTDGQAQRVSQPSNAESETGATRPRSDPLGLQQSQPSHSMPGASAGHTESVSHLTTPEVPVHVQDTSSTGKSDPVFEVPKSEEKLVEDTPTIATEDAHNATGAEEASIQLETPAPEVEKQQHEQAKLNSGHDQRPESTPEAVPISLEKVPEHAAPVPEEEKPIQEDPVRDTPQVEQQDQKEDSEEIVLEDPSEPVEPEPEAAPVLEQSSEVGALVPEGNNPQEVVAETQQTDPQPVEITEVVSETTPQEPVQVDPSIEQSAETPAEEVQPQAPANPVVEDDEELQLEDDEPAPAA